jgi:uncharacterized membrane protein YfcA
VLLRLGCREARTEVVAALLPPIGLLAAHRYYRAGHVDFAVAGLLAIGFSFRASIGAIVATRIEGHVLRKVFGVSRFAA